MSEVTNETLYRQVHPSGGNPIYIDESLPNPVHHSSLRPAPNDSDGLSLLRHNERSDIWCGQRPGNPHVCYKLLTLNSERLREMAKEQKFDDLNFEISPDDFDKLHGEPYAHCVATQINIEDYKSNKEIKKKITNWTLKVSSQLSINDVIGPFGTPTEADPYRRVAPTVK